MSPPHCNSQDLLVCSVCTVLFSTLLYSTLLYSTLLYSTLLYSTLLYSTLLYSTLLYSTISSIFDGCATRELNKVEVKLVGLLHIPPLVLSWHICGVGGQEARHWAMPGVVRDSLI
jgi:uncharacterized membrane protein